jgi:hypothetical protein
MYVSISISIEIVAVSREFKPTGFFGGTGI